MSAKHEPTDKTKELATSLSGYGVPQPDIARLIGVSLNTLLAHYREELDLGMAQANAKVGESLYRQAVSGNTTAAIFWLKARCGWREKQEVEVTGKDGGALEVKHFTGVPRPEDFDPETLKAIIEAMGKPDAA